MADGLRWPAVQEGWPLADGRRAVLVRRMSAAVVRDRRDDLPPHAHPPLTVWCEAAWRATSAKNGVSAKTLPRLLGCGSDQTAWARLHRFRTARGRPGREPLTGTVEVDETFIGGSQSGKRGGGALGKTLVVVAVEILSPKGFGRCRLRIIPNAQVPALRSFLLDSVAPGARIVTDGLRSYPPATLKDYRHQPLPGAHSRGPAHGSLPGVPRVASLLKRWLLGTHQGAVEADPLQGYLDEFAFRFNRRRSAFRGLLFRRLLEQAVRGGPITYRSRVVNPTPKRQKPRPPGEHRVGPASLEINPKKLHPWRNYNP